MIEASDGSLYTGIATDVERRFAEHALGREGKKGAKFFYGRKPVKVVYKEGDHSRSSASTREAEIKSFSRQAKLKLIAPQA